MYVKTTWQDRAVSTPNKYTKTLETSGSVTLVADPGTVTQAGTPINATALNNMEAGVLKAHKRSVGSVIYACKNLGGL